EDAVLDLAEFFELLHAGLDLARQEIARAAGATELQHGAENLGLVDLRAVGHPFRVVAEHAGLERAILAVVGFTLDHEPILIEIVPVPRPGIIGAEPRQRELEVAGRAGHPSASVREWNVPPRCSSPRTRGTSSCCTIFMGLAP